MATVDFQNHQLPHLDDTRDSDLSRWVGKLNTGNEDEQNEAARHLADQGSNALHELCVALVFGREQTRVSAAWALGEIGGPQAVEALCDALSDTASNVRAACARALGEIGDPSVEIYLEKLAIGDTASTVRYAATRALQRIEAIHQRSN